MNTDELIAQMEKDETEDARLITPIDYGRLRGIAPQLIYYYIRAGHIKSQKCECGRKVMVKEEADGYLRSVGKLKPLSEGPAEHASEQEL